MLLPANLEFVHDCLHVMPAKQTSTGELVKYYDTRVEIHWNWLACIPPGIKAKFRYSILFYARNPVVVH